MQNHIKDAHFNMYNLFSVLCNEDFACEECDFKTSEYAHLEDHIKSTHENGDITVIRDTLEEEYVTMMGEKCKLCDYVASNDAELTEHLMSLHVESN